MNYDLSTLVSKLRIDNLQQKLWTIQSKNKNAEENL